MENNLKVGDTISFKKDLILNKIYGNVSLLSKMYETSKNNKIYTIIHISNSSIIIDDGYGFGYSLEMFELNPTKIIHDYPIF